MVTSDNIYRIDFEEECGSVIVPHSIIFNKTQISIDEVEDLIDSDAWEFDDRIIELRPKQVKYLMDKEN